jgi:hypothetical protein
MGRVQFEKEQLARLQRSERSGPRGPKIYFAQMRLRSQMLEPVAIGDGDDELDGHAMLPQRPCARRVKRTKVDPNINLRLEEKMPRYVIERQYLLPVYEHLLIDAPNFETACREALDEIARPWSENAKDDFESARPTTITEAVELPGSAFLELRAIDEEGQAGLGTVLYHSGLDPSPIPAEFAEGDREDEKVGFS